MGKRFTIKNQTDRMVGCDFASDIREPEKSNPRLRQLSEATIGSCDIDWKAAYNREELQRTHYNEASVELDKAIDAMMNSARFFFKGVYDADGHSVPRVLAQCLNGILPSDLEQTRLASRVRALKSLTVTIRGQPHLHYNPSRLAELAAAVKRAELAMKAALERRRAWQEAVRDKKLFAKAFDQSYGALVHAARRIGLGSGLPVFVETDGPEEESDEDPNTEPLDLELPEVTDNDVVAVE